jgi:hypothetical protein
VVGSSAVLRLNFCAKNPPLRQAAKRYVPLKKKKMDWIEIALEEYKSLRAESI